MKRTLFFLFLFCNITLHSQEVSKQASDSLYSKMLKEAFKQMMTGKHNAAIKLSNEALAYAKKNNVDSLKAEAYSVISMSFLGLEDKETAFEHLIKAEAIYLRLNDSLNLVSVYNNFGVYYGKKKEQDSLIIYAKKAIDIAEAIDSKKYVFTVSYNLGHAYAVKDDIDSSKMYFDKALKLIDYAGNDRVRGDLFIMISYLEVVQKKYKAAHENVDKSINVYKKGGYIQNISDAYAYKAEVYTEQNKLVLSNNYLLKQIKLKDSIAIIEKEDLTKAIGGKYKLKQDKEKLHFIEKEKLVQKKLLVKSTLFNWLLAFLIVLLLYTAYWIYTKNKELKMARDRAFGLSKVKSDFYSEISHELRTPLYAVIELSSLLLKEHVNVKDRRYLESLNFSGTHLLSLINNVLQLNKVESGELKIEHSKFNLKVLITNIIGTMEYGLKESDNTIKLNYDNHIPQKMIGDSLKLTQVLINLLSNAIKFTKNDVIELTINRIKTEEQTGEVAVFFKISDGVLAVSKEKQLQVFDDYYHKHSNNENSYKDTGLGLSVVKSSLEVMNSSINIGNEEGGRSSFYFTVQFEEIQDADNEEGTYQKELDIIKGYKLLIVDDNKINQLVTKKVLDQLNVFSEVTDSGEKAIALVKANHYDCVLMDLQMPKIDGYEATRQIRLFNKDIPIIALTAATSEEIEKKIKVVEMNGSILKPFMINDFVGAIVREVQKK